MRSSFGAFNCDFLPGRHATQSHQCRVYRCDQKFVRVHVLLWGNCGLLHIHPRKCLVTMQTLTLCVQCLGANSNNIWFSRVIVVTFADSAVSKEVSETALCIVVVWHASGSALRASPASSSGVGLQKGFFLGVPFR